MANANIKEQQLAEATQNPVSMDNSWYSAAFTVLFLNLYSYRYKRAAPHKPPNSSSKMVNSTEAQSLRLEALTQLPPTNMLLPGSLVAPCGRNHEVIHCIEDCAASFMLWQTHLQLLSFAEDIVLTWLNTQVVPIHDLHCA